MPSGKVIVDNHFARYNQNVENALERALVQAGAVVAETARTVGSPQGYDIGAIQEQSRPELRPRGFKRGVEVWVVNRDFRALWFEKGTYLRRKGVLSASTTRRRNTASGQARLARAGGNQGVYPQKFLRRGLTAGRAALMTLVRAEMSRIP